MKTDSPFRQSNSPDARPVLKRQSRLLNLICYGNSHVLIINTSLDGFHGGIFFGILNYFIFSSADTYIKQIRLLLMSERFLKRRTYLDPVVTPEATKTTISYP